MNYARSDVRYNCFRMKRGNVPKRQDIIDEIQRQLGEYTWSEFGEEWDVAVTPTRLKVIPSIKDINKVSEICAYKYIAAKKGFEIDNLSDEEEAIISMIESQFLDGKMSWSNYRETWGVRWENERNRIETYLMHTPQGQITVTDEMINRVLERGSADNNALFEQIKVTIKDSTEE